MIELTRAEVTDTFIAYKNGDISIVDAVDSIFLFQSENKQDINLERTETIEKLKEGKIGFCPECGDFIGKGTKCGECEEFNNKNVLEEVA